ncbi:hypothetical protein BJ508DRAFT_141641 [Ascobolus immersus RN42]|uniref:Uncharacterized protein n=1 Tax=Ascobolus immersus RN42 TaxID=1160509 RepID=A0A3N4I049_ASCIM|nr:hypothetical protein BJ508DRAFT_141641 [Ascobolus immersus RN42]
MAAPVSIPARTFTRSDNFPDATPPASSFAAGTSYFGMIPPTTRHFSHTPDPMIPTHTTKPDPIAADGFFLQDTTSPSSSDHHSSSDLDLESSSDSEATDEEDWCAMGSDALRAKTIASPGSFASWRSGGANSFAVGSPNMLGGGRSFRNGGFSGSPNVAGSFVGGRSFVGSPNVATSYGTSPAPWDASWEGPRAARGGYGMSVPAKSGIAIGAKKGYGRPGPSALSGISKLASSNAIETNEEERARKEREAIEALVSLRSV